jgi:hypothetical protein
MDFMGISKHAKDHDRKRVEQTRKHVINMVENFASQNCQKNLASQNYPNGLLTIGISVHTSIFRKWQKGVESLNNVIHISRNNFNDENKQEVLRKFLDKDNVKGFLLRFARNAKDIEQKLCLLENLKSTYAQLALNISKENFPIKNALLIVVVSN